MPRIAPVSIESAPESTKPLLEGINKKLGKVPNLLGTLGVSPAALNTYLNLGDALSKGSLGAPFHEQLAVAIANHSKCGYCASAHTVIGKMNGVDGDELAKNLHGEASDPKVQAAINLAYAIIDSRGFVSDSDVSAARDGGLSDEELLEVLSVTITNLFTNYANHMLQTENDFPKVELVETAGAK